MRISDGNSDVCSSDLTNNPFGGVAEATSRPDASEFVYADIDPRSAGSTGCCCRRGLCAGATPGDEPQSETSVRSEERRGGKECVSRCRSRGSPYHNKNKKKTDV